jgi:hypothetical protein
MSNLRKTSPPRGRIDWAAVRDTIDLASVATNLLGQATGRRGGKGRNLWWCCPLGNHEDRNPSFCVTPGKRQWRCYGCGERGDAASLVMKVKGLTFPEAIHYLTDSSDPSGKQKPGTPAPFGPREGRSGQKPPHPLGSKVSDRGQEQSRGMSPEAALALVEAAAARLWSPEGAEALADLTGPRRCLKPETIRAARLGWTPPLNLPGKPRGVVIPWFAGPALTLVKVRQPEGRRPKYYEAFRDPARHAGTYPGPEAIRIGRPLIVAEGELDGLMLRQALGDLAAVVTLGSASARPDARIIGAMLAACPWYVATDADPAGDRAAADWPAPVRRVRPPGPFKDWTDAHLGGVDLRRWWGEVLGGTGLPALFTWPDLAAWRWGPALVDSTPGIVIEQPDGARMHAATEASATEPDGDGAGILGSLLTRLNERGLRIDGRLVYPHIAVGTVTGRVVYACIDPPPQGIPKDDRPRRIGPVVEGRVIVRADYGQIEPRILLAILRHRGSIAWDVGPDEDLYRVLAGKAVDRDLAKISVNRIINGGRPDPGATGRLADFIAATESYRSALATGARTRGFIETLTGRRIPLPTDENNHAGKAVNRVVQGTAADVFNRAVVAVDRQLEARGLPAAVAFLLHDELWVECDQAVVGTVAELVRVEMEGAALADGVMVPVRFSDASPQAGRMISGIEPEPSYPLASLTPLPLG